MKSFIALVPWTMLTMQFATNEAAFGVIRWNRRIGDFMSIPGFPTYDLEPDNRVLQSRKEETHNFNGKSLHLTYFQEFGFIHFVENNTKVTGISGDLWTALSEMLNFTLVVRRSRVTSLGLTFENGSYSGILEDARLNRTDIIPKMELLDQRIHAVRFTTPFWLNRTFAHGQWQRNRSWMFRQFTAELWGSVFIFMVILSVGSLTMQRVLSSYRVSMLRTSFFDHIFTTFATMCNQGTTFDGTSNGVKILTVTVSTFSWLICVGYSARLIYSMAHEVFGAPYTDLKSLYENTNFHIVVMNGSFTHLWFSHAKPNTVTSMIRKANRVIAVANLTELSEKLCVHSKNYILLDGVNDVGVRDTRVCSLLPAASDSITVHIAAGLSKRVQNKRSIDIGILKLREFGITEAIKNRYLSLSGQPSPDRQINSLAIDLDQMSLILAILSVGIVASIFICVAENIFFALKNRKNNRCLPHRFPAIEEQLFPSSVHAGKCRFATKRSRNLYFMELYNNIGKKPRMS